MMDIIGNLLPDPAHFYVTGYWIAFFAALVETTIGIGLIIPGSTIILILGALSARGSFDAYDLIWFAATGAILGDNINYYWGRKQGASTLCSLINQRTIEHDNRHSNLLSSVYFVGLAHRIHSA
jgi:undecaprenyl-diphosphatase